MSLLDDNPDGSTPLSTDDIEGLRFRHIRTRAQLNEMEAANILSGQDWAAALTDLTQDVIFSREFIVALHKNLLGDVWTWAGRFRQRELNIGVDPINISVDLYNFLEDAKCWIEFKHYEPLELCARIQHRLVQIHPFCNGNGRHSRIFTDIVRQQLLHEKPMKWAWGTLENISVERAAYIRALRQADKGDFTAIVQYLTELNGPLETAVDFR